MDPQPSFLSGFTAPALLQAGAASALLVLALLTARRLFRRRLPAGWSYFLGLAAMLRLALPGVPSAPAGWPSLPFLFHPAAQPAGISSPATGPPAPAVNPHGTDSSPGPAAPDSSSRMSPDSPMVRPGVSTPVAPAIQETSEPPPRPREFPSLPETAAAAAHSFLLPGVRGTGSTPDKITDGGQPARTRTSFVSGTFLTFFYRFLWPAGTLAILLRAAGRELRFRRDLARHGIPAGRRVQELGLEAARLLGCRRRPAFLEYRSLAGPASGGWLRPLVLLPPGLAGSLTDRELAHILSHEAAHLRHRDTLMNWLLLALCALHWFNPAAWLCRRILIADRELLRDRAALRALARRSPAPAAEYGRTLLKLSLAPASSRSCPVPLSAFTTLLFPPRRTAPPWPARPCPPSSPGMAGFFAAEKEIHRRILMITQPASHPRRLTVSLATLAAATALTVTFTQAQPPAAVPGPGLATVPEPPAPEALPVPDPATAGATASDPVSLPPSPAPSLTPAAGLAAPASLPATPPPLLPAPPLPTPVLADPSADGNSPFSPSPAPSSAPDPGSPRAVPAQKGLPGSRQAESSTIQALRAEIARLNQEMNAHHGFRKSEAAAFESEIAQARAQLAQSRASGFGPAHPRMKSLEAHIQSMEDYTSHRKDREARTRKETLKARQPMIDTLISLKKEESILSTRLEFTTAESAEEKEQRMTLIERLAAIRSGIREMETRLQYETPAVTEDPLPSQESGK